MSIYDTLNREQQQAVCQTEGPVLILAGAGSGKTRVITHRIAYLMEECEVNPWNILAITFTNKAAGEMRERVDRLIGFGSESVWISTFHSMCVRILRRHIDLLGYQNSFTIYDTDDQKTVMKDICKRLRIDTKQLKERQILGAISSAKNELISPLRYREDHMGGWDYYGRQIGDCYEEYQKVLKKNNALDFDDLLMKTVDLFHLHPEVLENYQNRFRYIMVDEYQDTNNAQFELVRLLAAKYRNLCVVGDDDQSIYRFRGANINNILDFEKVYPEALVVRLEQNYRSTQNVLDAANAVISNNARRKQKKLWTDRGHGSEIHVRRFQTAYEEASYIAEDIARAMSEDSRLKYSDFAILYRTNAQSRLLEDRLVLSGMPYNVVGGTNFYDRREIRDMLAYLKTVDNGSDDLAVRRILNVPRRGIGQTTMARVGEYALRHDISFFEALERASDIPAIGRAAGKLKEFVELIHGFRRKAEEGSLKELLENILDRSGYAEALRESDEEDAEDRIANLDELISKIADYEYNIDSEEMPTLSGFLEEVALVADIDSVEGDDNRILLMTLHSAKGLEFPHVYIAGMEDGIFPSAMALNGEDPEGEEEERRLAYVGITRAKDELTLTSAASRMARGEVQYNPVSRFLEEIPEELLDRKSGRGNAFGDDFDDPEEDDYEYGYADTYGRSRLAGKFGGTGYGLSSRSSGNGSRGKSAKTGGAGPSIGGGLKSLEGIAGLQKGTAGLKSAPSASGTGTGTGRRTASDRRPRAVYAGTSGTDEAKKPYIARAASASRKAASRKKGAAEPVKPDYTVGDRVHHLNFGDGTVENIEKGPKDYKVTVQFDDAGRKIMYAGFAKLEKL